MIPMTQEQFQGLADRASQLGIVRIGCETLAINLNGDWQHSTWTDRDGVHVHTVEQWLTDGQCFMYMPVQGNVAQTVLDVFVSLFDTF